MARGSVTGDFTVREPIVDYPSKFVRVALGLVAVAVVDCSSPSSPCTSSVCAQPTGTLVVTITDGDGTTPAVVVTGPNGYSMTLGTTSTLTLQPGTYTIVADSTSGSGAVVGTVTDTGHVTGSPAVVTANANLAASVAYSAKSRVGGLWVGNNGYQTTYLFASGELGASSAALPPADSIVAGPTALAGGLALDASGNLWVDDANSDTIRMYTTTARNKSGSKTPSGILVSASLRSPFQLTFDAQGDLWVVNCGTPPGFIAKFTPTQLAAGGTQTAAVIIGGSAANFCPQGMAFDASGNAWVTDYENNHLLQYSAAQLLVSGTPTPIDTIGSNAGSLTRATSAVFDGGGNLWVSTGAGTHSGTGGNTVVAFTPTQLTASGSPAPNVTIGMPSNADPYGLAFDRSGSLWVTDAFNNAVYSFTRTQLAASGSPAPAVSIGWSSSNYQALQPLFDPYATAAVPPNANRVRSGVASRITRVPPVDRRRVN